MRKKISQLTYAGMAFERDYRERLLVFYLFSIGNLFYWKISYTFVS